jgi:DNA-binding IscR family transcriptional regulator
LKTIVYLIENSSRKVNIEEIAKTQNIPESFLRRVVADLDRTGIVVTYK